MRHKRFIQLAIFIFSFSSLSCLQTVPERNRQEPTALSRNRFLFDARGSSDPDGDKLSYSWDFGDGSTSNQTVARHAYERPGEYTVFLTVKDKSGTPCDTAIAIEKVKVEPPSVPLFTSAPAVKAAIKPEIKAERPKIERPKIEKPRIEKPKAEKPRIEKPLITPPIYKAQSAKLKPVFIAPPNACVNEEVVFNALPTADRIPDTLAYHWDFGDGTLGQGEVVTHTYNNGGGYKVTLTVENESNSGSSQRQIRVNTPPTVDAGPDIDLCIPASQDYRVALSANGYDPDGDKLTYTWKLGQCCVIAYGKTITHDYGLSGNYTVRVIVDDGSGTDCSLAEDSVNVRLNRQPRADAGGDISCSQRQEVVFDAGESSFDIDAHPNYTWDFGDGTAPEKGEKAIHTYSRSGNYKVSLALDDGKKTKCSISTDTINVRVNPITPRPK